MKKTISVYFSPEIIDLLSGYYNFTPGMCPVDLSLLQRIQLFLFSRVKVLSVPTSIPAGVSMDYYVVRCDVHGLFLDYPHGVHETCTCQKCAENAL